MKRELFAWLTTVILATSLWKSFTVEIKNVQRESVLALLLGSGVKEQEVQVENDKIMAYKVIMKITFVLDET